MLYRRPNRSPSPSRTTKRRPTEGERCESGDGRHREDRDRGLGRAGWQDELEERHGISPLRLEWSHRAVAATDEEPRPLDQQEADARPKPSIAPPGRGADPDVAERRQAHHGPRGMDDPKRPGSTTQGCPAHRHRMSHDRGWNTARPLARIKEPWSGFHARSSLSGAIDSASRVAHPFGGRRRTIWGVSERFRCCYLSGWRDARHGGARRPVGIVVTEGVRSSRASAALEVNDPAPLRSSLHLSKARAPPEAGSQAPRGRRASCP